MRDDIFKTGPPQISAQLQIPNFLKILMYSCNTTEQNAYVCILIYAFVIRILHVCHIIAVFTLECPR